ncbi:MAG: Sec-independent protein translocase protein TatB [Yoonia sp.]|jgi:sec-independent protein translocase protein TatB
MFGLGWSELLVVGIVALIVIGPKDLPGLFRTMGQFTGKARMMAREFSRAMEQAADDAGVKDISKTLNAAANPKKFGVDKLKEATGTTKAPETTLSPERQAAKEKMSKAMGDAAVARKAREAEEAAAKAPTDTPAPETPTPEAKT